MLRGALGAFDPVRRARDAEEGEGDEDEEEEAPEQAHEGSRRTAAGGDPEPVEWSAEVGRRLVAVAEGWRGDLKQWGRSASAKFSDLGSRLGASFKVSARGGHEHEVSVPIPPRLLEGEGEPFQEAEAETEGRATGFHEPAGGA